MNDSFDLQRFVRAQDPIFNEVVDELRAGRKRTHWMWFVFPQALGLGRSAMAREYGIASLDEARAYLADPVLGERLMLCTECVLAVEGRSPHDIFGSPDDAKFCSSMTLFALASPDADSLFTRALAHFCGGTMDENTRALVG